MGLREKKKRLKLQFRVGDLDLPKRRGIQLVGRRRKMHRCALVAERKRAELTLLENVKYTRRNEASWRGGK